MKRYFSLCIAAVILLTGCSTRSDADSAFSVSFDHSYSSEQIMADVNDVVYGLLPIRDYVLYTVIGKDGERHGEAVSLLTGEHITLTQSGVPVGVNETDDGCSVFWVDVKYEESKIVDASYSIVTYDSDLHERTALDVTEDYTFTDADKGCNFWYQDQEGDFIINQGELYFKGKDGTSGIIPATASFAKVFRGSDDKLYAIGSDNGYIFGEIDTDAMQFVPIAIPALQGWCNGVTEGFGDFLCCYADGKGFFGVKQDLSTEKLIDWENSDFDSGTAPEALLPDGDLIVSEFQMSNSRTTFWKLHPRSHEETDSVQLISMAVFGNHGYLQEMVHAYNRQAQGHRIVVKDYADQSEALDAYESSEKAFTAMQNDMLNGIVPDLLCLNGADYAKLSDKGLFEDWYPWMAQDSEFCNEDYYMNFFDAMAYRGRLERMAFCFNVQFMEAKTCYVGEKMTRTVQDYAQMRDNLPEGMTLFSAQQSREAALYSLILSHLDSYIHYEDSTCTFDTPEFVQLLEMCMACPEEVGCTTDDYAWAENRALLRDCCLSSLSGFHGETAGYFHGEPLTLLGMPQSELHGNGGCFIPDNAFAASATSAHKEEIWAFIKFALRESNQMQAGNNGFCVNRKALKKQFAQEIAGTADFEMWYGMDGEQLNLGRPTEDEAEQLLTAIDGVGQVHFEEPNLTAIVTEEASMFFAGAQSAEVAADCMQKRVGLYLAERN